MVSVGLGIQNFIVNGEISTSKFLPNLMSGIGPPKILVGARKNKLKLVQILKITDIIRDIWIVEFTIVEK